MSNQPAGMESDAGVILTVGFDTSADRAAIVMPFVTESSILTPEILCSDLVQSFIAGPLAQLLAVISSNASAVFVNGEGMVDGRVPYRQGYAVGDQPGTRGASPLPSQVTALVAFYADPADLPANTRMKVAKNFFPFIASVDVVQDSLVSDLQEAIYTFASTVQQGFPSVEDPVSNWYRVLAAVKPRVIAPVTRTIVGEARAYVATQRRRLKVRLT